MTSSLLRHPLRGLTLFIFLISVGRCPAASDPARLAPEQSTAYVGWVALNDGEWRLMRWLEAVLGATATLDALGPAERDTARTLFEIASIATRHTGAVSLVLRPDSPRPDMVIVIECGADAEKLAAAFHRLADAATPDIGSRSLDLQGMRFQSRVLEDGESYFWAVHGEYFLAGNHERAAGLAASVALGRGPTLADVPGYQRAREHTQVRLTPWHFGLYVDLARVLERVRADLERSVDEAEPQPFTISELFNVSGLSAVRSLSVFGDAIEYGRRMSLYVQVEESGGLLAKLLRQKTLRDDELRVIPRDASWATAWNLDLAELWRDVLSAVEKLSPDYRLQLDGMLATFRRFLGFSITDDLLPALGDTAVLYDAPDHGGVLFTGVVLVADLADPAAVEGMSRRLVEFLTPLAAQAQARLTLRQMPWQGHSISYLLVGGLPVPLAPAWAAVGQRGVFSFYPQTVATALERVAESPRDSLLDQPDFQAARALLPKEAIALGFIDSRSAHRWWYTLRLLAQTAVAALSVGGEVELDLAGLPPFPQDRAAIRNTVWSHHVDEGGLLVTSVGSSPWQYFFVGDTSLLALLGAGAALVGTLDRTDSGAADLEESVKLRQIGIAAAVYASDHDGRMPQSLEELVEMGFLSMSELYLGEEDARIGFAYVRGLSESDPPESVLVYRREPQGDMVNFLRRDGMVESVPLAELRERLRTTLQRLGREAEMPAW